jgi:hypothetical protein
MLGNWPIWPQSRGWNLHLLVQRWVADSNTPRSLVQIANYLASNIFGHVAHFVTLKLGHELFLGDGHCFLGANHQAIIGPRDPHAETKLGSSVVETRVGLAPFETH